MRAVEYAIEHDDGQSMRALDIADVIIIAPSRCGKTPDHDVPRAAVRPARRELPAHRRRLPLRRPAADGRAVRGTSASA